MSNSKQGAVRKVVAQNRRARHDYEILETFEAGIVLVGTEVKSLRSGQANIQDAHAMEIGGEIILLNAYIPEYSKASRFNHETRRPRKLLLHAKEVRKLIGKVKTKGMTLVALSIYFNAKNRAKVELALVKGKKEHDKRAAIKDRDWKREQARTMKGERGE